MGDDIVLKDIKVIQGGLLQIDLYNNNTESHIRFFANPDELFSKIGKSMKKNMVEYDKKFMEENYKDPNPASE